MKENLKIIKEMGMEYYIYQMELNMKENLKIIIMMDMEYIIIVVLKLNMKENGKMDFLIYFLKD